MADEDLRLRASLDDDVSAVLARIEARLQAAERKVEDLGSAGRRMGPEVEGGARQAEGALQDVEEQADDTRGSVRELGDETERTGDKARRSGKGWHSLAKDLGRWAKRFGGFTRLMSAFKWTSIIGLVFALAGAVSALGAGAVIAVGGIGAMIPGLAAIGPLGLAAYLGMKATTLGLKEMEPEVESIKTQFDGLGRAVADGGLRSGVAYLSDRIGEFSDRVYTGFERIGGSLGRGARLLGDFVSRADRLRQTTQILATMATIIDILAPGLIGVGGGVLSLFVASLPAGERLTGVLAGLGVRFGAWADAQLASGKATEYINNALEILIRGVTMASDFVIGLYRIFSIAASAGREFGMSVGNAAQRFKEWTGSVEGQASIREYFMAAMPAIREMVLLVGMLLSAFAQLATSESTAPLLAQLRTEFLPALGELILMISGQDGLLPSLLSAATGLAELFTSVDMGAVVFLVAAFANMVAWLTNLIETTPGMSMLVSAFALLWVVGGAVLSVLGWMVSAWAWLAVARAGTGTLTVAQWLLHKALLAVRAAAAWARAVLASMGGVTGIIHALRTAFWLLWAAVTGPIGLVVLAVAAVIAIILLLWHNCEWFRDAVTAAWDWIRNAAVTAWNAVANAAVTAWNWVVSTTTTAVNWIVAIATNIWTHGLKPTFDVIVIAWQVVCNVIGFIFQTALYVIVGLIIVVGYIFKEIFIGIGTAAVMLWQFVILPVVQFAAWAVMTAWTAVFGFFGMIFGLIGERATFLWGIVTAVFQMGASNVMMIWTPVAGFFTWIWGMISGAAQVAWAVISSVTAGAAGTAQAAWAPVGASLSALFGIVRAAGEACWAGISSAARAVAGAVSSAWGSVVSAVRGAYNVLARAWNSIPSISLLGFSFSLPKLPTLWHGGTIEFGTALVGEHGPEPLIGAGGRYLGMLGERGPEIATGLPRGGYVVPNLDTLTRMPGLLKTIPTGVASAVARSVPGYEGMGRPAAPIPPPPSGRRGGDDERELAGAVRTLARTLADRPPPISADGRDTEEKVLAALRRHDRIKEARGRYEY